jgi:tetratricopeptide (TPR) repeat protein
VKKTDTKPKSRQLLDFKIIGAVLAVVIIVVVVIIVARHFKTTQKVTTHGSQTFSSYNDGLKAIATLNFDDAINQFNTVLAATPNDADALRQLALAQYQAAKYSDAIVTYQKLATQKNYGAYASNGLGNIARDQKQYDQAESYYRQAINQDKTFCVAYSNLAILLIDQGNSDQAAQVLADGLKSNPNSSELKATKSSLALK